MKKIVVLIMVLFAFLTFTGCTNENEISSVKDYGILSNAQLINDSNRELIGKEINDTTPPVVYKKAPSGTSNNLSSVDQSNNIPQNNIVQKLASSEILSPSSITEFTVKDGITPEIIMPNGSAVVFSQNEGQGWICKEGNRLLFEFEKYPSEVTTSQTLIIGYIVDGVLYEGETFTNLDGTYQLDVPKSGEYYVYLISATSDYLTFKEGLISIVN